MSTNPWMSASLYTDEALEDFVDQAHLAELLGSPLTWGELNREEGQMLHDATRAGLLQLDEAGGVRLR